MKGENLIVGTVRDYAGFRIELGVTLRGLGLCRVGVFARVNDVAKAFKSVIPGLDSRSIAVVSWEAELVMS